MNTPAGFQPKHPDAKLALRLAALLDGAPPDLITKVLNNSACPRPLFVLAVQLMKGHR